MSDRSDRYNMWNDENLFSYFPIYQKGVERGINKKTFDNNFLLRYSFNFK